MIYFEEMFLEIIYFKEMFQDRQLENQRLVLVKLSERITDGCLQLHCNDKVYALGAFVPRGLLRLHTYKSSLYRSKILLWLQ